MTKDNIKFINISGFYSTGSSAVFDFLSGYPSIKPFNEEFLIPCYLVDLYATLITGWNRISAYEAIDNFEKKIAQAHRSNGLLKPGLNYKKYFGNTLLKASNEFIDEISTFHHIGEKPSDFLYYNYLKLLKFKIMKKTNRRKFKNILYFSKPTSEEFLKAAQNFIQKIFVNFSDNETHILLDQAVNTPTYFPSSSFFNPLKLVIVDRDPRDVFVELLRLKDRAFGYGLNKMNSRDRVKNFSVWWKKSREKYESEDTLSLNVLNIRFEDFIMNHEKSKETLMNFLNLDETKHEHPRFNVEKSKLNIELWKKHSNQIEIMELSEQLKKFIP